MAILTQGGVLMIPLLICSVLMVAVVVERMVVYVKMLPIPLAEAEQPAAVLKRLRRHLMILYTIIVIAPMLGLLGTVVGMMKCFHLLGGTVGQFNPQVLSAGISEALITTAAGLLVTVIATAFYNYFQTRLEEYVFDYNASLKETEGHG